MPTIYVIRGILISMFGFDHNPPHIHVQYGEYKFTITLDDRIVKGAAPSSVIKEVNEFMDSHMSELKSPSHKNFSLAGRSIFEIISFITEGA